MSGSVDKYKYVLAAISGVLAGGVFSFGLPALLLPIFIAVFFWVMSSQAKSMSLKKITGLSALFFWTFYAVVLIWFLDTDVTLLAGLSGENAKLLLGLCLVIMVSLMTAVSLPMGFIFYKHRKKLAQPDWRSIALIASVWVVVEWCRSWVFSIFLYAPGASMGDYWNFGSLGLGLSSTPFGLLSSLIGMYGLSAVVVTVSLLLVRAANQDIKPLVAALIILVAISGIYHVIITGKQPEQTLTASVLQREKELDDLDTVSTDLKYLDSSLKDLIVLTEYSNIFTPGREAYAKKYVTDRLKNEGRSIDVYADFSQSGERYNMLEVRDKSGELKDTQTKQLLIPTGEYLPGIVQQFYKFTGQNHINQSFSHTRRLYRGQPPRTIHTESVIVAPVACSGILGRNIYRELVANGGEVLTNSASLLIFSGSRAYFRQSLQMARFHAVANQRTFIQASMGAPAFVMNERGDFIIAPEDTKTAFIDFRFSAKSNKTLYTKIGEWPLILAGFITAVYAGNLGWKWMSNRRKV